MHYEKETNPNPLPKEPIVFFDGVCGLCNGFVDFVLKHDTKQSILFSPLQGETAKHILHEQYTTAMNTVVYYKQGKVWIKSSAALMILKDMGGLWRLFFVLMIVPAFIRNFVYDFISRYRYAWFGKKETCRLPSAEERLRFLN